MNSLLKKIRKNFWMLRSLPYSLFFNLKYLPIRQAVKLPILLYKPHFISLHGHINIDYDNIRFGIIRLGQNMVSIYPNNGVKLEINGSITFKGRCSIGNNSFLSVGKNGHAIFGDNFIATTSLKLVAYNKIESQKNVLIGWNCMICDTDFHATINTQTHEIYPKQAPIILGDNVWVANNCTINKGCVLPPYTIVASHSLVNKDYSSIPPYCLLAGTPVKLKKENIGRAEWFGYQI